MLQKKKSKIEQHKILFDIKNLQKTYSNDQGTHTVLNIKECTIYKKQPTAIIGVSGAGKSTLLFQLGLLSDYTKTKDRYIHYYSKDEIMTDYNLLSEKEKRMLRNKNYGFIFQESYLLSHLSSLMNCEMPILLTKKDGSSQAEKILKNLFSPDEIHNKILEKKPRQLSGGQRQRVAIARALVHEPHVIFGDEISGNLDPKTGEKIFETIKSFLEKSSNLLLITHNFKQAYHYCDRFILLHQGRIVGDYIKGKDIDSDEDLYQKYSRET